jgi:hypothetical protein
MEEYLNGYTPGSLYHLVCAVTDEEITLREFGSALNPLASESIQYLGIVLGLQASLRQRPSERLSIARGICRARADRTRSLN